MTPRVARQRNSTHATPGALPPLIKSGADFLEVPDSHDPRGGKPQERRDRAGRPPPLPDPWHNLGASDRLAAIVESADVAILSTDLEGGITTWNAGAERLFGWTAPEIIGRPMLTIVPPEHRNQAWQFHQKARNGDHVQSYETVRWRKDRRRVDVVANISPIEGRDGAVLGVSVIYRDITEWRRAEEKLRLTEERFRALIENSQDAIELTDKSGFIVYVSPSIGRVLGHAPEDLVGKRMSELFHPEEIPRMMRFYEDLVATPGKAASAEWRALHKDGTYRWLEGHGVNMLDDPAVNAVVSNFRDVTVRKARAVALAENEARLRAILESAMDAVISMDASGRVTYFNPAASKAFGFAPEEVVGRELAEAIIPSALRDAHRAGMARYLATGEEVVLGKRVEMRALRKDGTEFPVELSITRVPTAGAPLFTAHLRDLTEKHAAEAALRASEERFRKLVEHSADAITVVDARARVIYASPALEAILGYSPGEVVGADGVSFIHPEDVPNAVAALQDLVARPGASMFLQQRLRHKDGTFRWFDGTVTNLLFDPAVGGVVSNFRDITDRIEAERILEESELRYHLVARASNEAIFDWNLGSNTVDWAEGMRALFGYDEAVVERARVSFFEFIHPEDRGRVEQGVRALLDKGSSVWADAYRFKRADGSFAHVTARGFAIYEDSGRPLRLVGTLSDVSERKALDEMREDVLDAISHEFRTPLTVIQGYAEMLAGGEWKPNAEEWARARQRIDRASKHVAFLLSSITELSKLRAGTFVARLRPTPTFEVLRGAVQAVEVRRGGPGRLVDVEVAPGAELLEADAPKLTMALVELIENAAKLSPEGSAVGLRAAREGGRVVISVHGQGPGMPERLRDDLFRPFTEADMSAARQAVGAGLGLALAGALLRAQGGEIAVESQPGAGTTVSVKLPAAAPPAPQAPQAPPPP